MPKQLICPNCSSTHVVKHTKNKSGTQRYRCRDCKKTFTPVPSANPPHRPKKIVSESTIDLEVCRAVLPAFEWHSINIGGVDLVSGTAYAPAKYEISVIGKDGGNYFAELKANGTTIEPRKSGMRLKPALERVKKMLETKRDEYNRLLEQRG